MSKRAEITGYSPSAKSVALAALFSITLAITLFAAGFAACTLSGTTATLSRLFSDFQTSMYLPEDTTELAVATRDFTVKPYTAGESTATKILAQKILDAAQRSSATGSLKAHVWKNVDIPNGVNATERMYTLAQAGSQYAFGPDEISHLIDCNKLIRAAVPILVIIAALALISGVILGFSCGKRPVARALVAAPALLLLAMVALGVWALIDFHGFFSAFHGLFFPQGNWTFPYDSLLICMLPTAFWIGMLVVWIVVTVGLSITSVLVGHYLLRR